MGGQQGTETATNASNGTGNATGTPPTGEQAAEEVNRLLPTWLPQIPDWLVEFTLAILIFTLAWYTSRLINRLLGRRIARRFRRPSVSRTVLRLVRSGVFTIAFFAVLNVYGLSLGNIALSVTVFSAVIGIVLAPIVGSIISGVFVLADQPYEVGDMIELLDRNQRGFVEDITLRYTKIFTLENTFLVIPNGSMRERDVVNYSAEDPRTRLSLDITVTYEGDLAEARSLIEEAARECEDVIEGGPDIRIGSARYPAAPTCYINAFADHGVHLTLRYWARDPYKLLTMRSRVQEKVWERLNEADVEVPYPHSHVVFDDTSGRLGVDADLSNGPPPGSRPRDAPDRDRSGGSGSSDSDGGGRSSGGSTRNGDRSDSGGPTRR